MKRQGSTLRKSKTGSATEITGKVSSPVSNRRLKAKSTITDLWLTSDDSEFVEKKNGNPLSRFSLSFIPGHGKKYSTYDGNRSIRVEQSTNEEWDGKAKTDDDKKNADPPKLRKKPFKEPRPLSESVSNFLLLNSQSSENLKNTKDEPVKAVEVEANTVTPDKKKVISHIPKLPTSFGVGKLLSHLQTTSGSTTGTRRHSRSMNSLLDVASAVDPKQQKSSSQAEIDIEEENKQSPLVTKSEDVLSKRASDASSVHHKNSVIIEESQTVVISDQTDCPPESKEGKIDVQVTSSVQEASACAEEDGKDQEILDDKKKDKKKAKDSTRRKSGLAMLKQFFYSAKIGIKRKGESTEKDKLSVNDTRSRKSSNESAGTSEKNSARTSLILETDANQQEIQSDQIPQQKQPTEDPKVKEVNRKFPESKTPELKEIPSIVILQRIDSQISEDVQSVQEEAFTATEAYKYEAKIIEIVEPEPFNQSDPILSPYNPEEADPPTPPQSSEDEFTDLSNKSTRNSAESTASLEKNILSKKPRKLSAIMTKEDMEVAELRPSLPLKTKIKCPSPGYDIPRTSPIPIPCSEQAATHFNDPVVISCLVVENMRPTEKKSLEIENKSSFSELRQKASTADCTTSETGSSSAINNVSHSIQTVNNDSISNSSTRPTSVISKRDSLNKPMDAERRISFAQAETEMVQEEMVQVLSFDSTG